MIGSAIISAFVRSFWICAPTWRKTSARPPTATSNGPIVPVYSSDNRAVVSSTASSSPAHDREHERLTTLVALQRRRVVERPVRRRLHDAGLGSESGGELAPRQPRRRRSSTVWPAGSRREQDDLRLPGPELLLEQIGAAGRLGTRDRRTRPR